MEYNYEFLFEIYLKLQTIEHIILLKTKTIVTHAFYQQNILIIKIIYSFQISK
jgi:hypothetical protein